MKSLVSDYEKGALNFLQYQSQSYKMINKLIDEVKENGIKVSKDREKWWFQNLYGDWIYRDPIVLKLMPELVIKDLTSDTHYHKLKLIGEELARHF